MAKPERLELQSADGVQLNLDALYQIAPSCFTEAEDPKTGKIKRMVNFTTLRQLLGDETVEDAPEAYEFNWVGKQAARAEVLQPIKKTLRPVKEDSVDWDNTQNLYIEGDNLEVLKLLQKSYLSKVKMIYIDPPYNTGNDFVYHDDFARTQEEEDLAAGNIDELGNRYIKNTDSNGKYHSDWCSMIYSRLMVARTLLTEDGVIFISIDDNEIMNMRKLCDEIFGPSNFIAQVITVSNPGGRDYKQVAVMHEYLLIYGKSDETTLNEMAKEVSFSFKDSRGGYELRELRNRNPKFHSGNRPNLFYPFYVNPNNVDQTGCCPISLTYSETYNIEVKPYNSQGGESVWRWGKIKANDNIKGNTEDSEIVARQKKDGGWNIYEKCRKSTSKVKSLWDETEMRTEDGTRLIRSMFGSSVFDHPKSLSLLLRCCEVGSNDDDIVMDFFSGSATTAHAVMKLNAMNESNRKFILVQLPETTPDESEARKAGFEKIPDISKERIRKASKDIKDEFGESVSNLDTGFRVFRVDSSNFEEVEHTPKDWNQNQLDLFLNNIKSDRDDLDLLFGCLLDWGVKLSLPMTSEEVDGKMIYTVNEGDLVACFAEKVMDNVVKAMADKMPLRVIFRDSCFEQDADKINIYETFKQLMDWTDEQVVKNIRVI